MDHGRMTASGPLPALRTPSRGTKPSSAGSRSRGGAGPPGSAPGHPGRRGVADTASLGGTGPVTFGSKPGGRRVASSAWGGATDGLHRAAPSPENMTRTNIRTVVEAKDEQRLSAAQLSAALTTNVQGMLARERKAHDTAVFELKRVRAGVEERELRLRDLLVQHRAMGLDPEAFLDGVAHPQTEELGGTGGRGFWATFLDRMEEEEGDEDARAASVHGERDAAAQTAASHGGLRHGATLPEKRAFVGTLKAKLARQHSAIEDVKTRGGTVQHIYDRLVQETVDLRRHLHALEAALGEERSRHAVLNKTKLSADSSYRAAQGRLRDLKARSEEVKRVWKAEIAQQRAVIAQKEGFAQFLDTVITRQEASTEEVADRVKHSLGGDQPAPSLTAVVDPLTATRTFSTPSRVPTADRPGTRGTGEGATASSPAQQLRPPSSASTRSAGPPGSALPVEVARDMGVEVALISALREVGLLRVVNEGAPPPPKPHRAGAPPPPLATLKVLATDGMSTRGTEVVADETVLQHQVGLQLSSPDAGLRASALDLETRALMLNPPVLDAGAILASCVAQDEVRKGLLRRRRAEETRIGKLGDRLVEVERQVAGLGLGPGLRATNKVLMDRQSAIARTHREAEQLSSQLKFLHSYVQQVQEGLGRVAERLLGLAQPPPVASPEDIEAVAEALVQRLNVLIQDTRRNFALKGENPNALAVPLRSAVDEGATGGEKGPGGAPLLPTSMQLDMQLAENLYLSPHNTRVSSQAAGRVTAVSPLGDVGTQPASMPPAQTRFLSKHAPVPRPLRPNTEGAVQPDSLGPARALVRRGVPPGTVAEAGEDEEEDGPVLDRAALKRMAGTLLRSSKPLSMVLPADDGGESARGPDTPPSARGPRPSTTAAGRSSSPGGRQALATPASGHTGGLPSSPAGRSSISGGPGQRLGSAATPSRRGGTAAGSRFGGQLGFED